MRSVTLAGGRLSTSRLGFGTSSLHHLRSAAARAELLRGCFDLGVRYFDTAPLYGHELAERELGRFLRGRRGALTVTTKYGIVPSRWMSRSTLLLYPGLALRRLLPQATRATRAPRREYGAELLIASLVQSLRNLATDHVDVLFVHDPPDLPDVLCEETVMALRRARADGKARFIGVSGSAAAGARIALAHPGLVDVLQIDAGDARDWSLLSSAGLAPDVSFGHLRAALLEAAPRSRHAVLHERLALAAAGNPHGVVLCSARTVERMSEIGSRLQELDGLTAGCA